MVCHAGAQDGLMLRLRKLRLQKGHMHRGSVTQDGGGTQVQGRRATRTLM